MIIGVGFDPRTSEATKHIYSKNRSGKRDLVGLRYFGNQAELETNSHPSPSVVAHLSDLEEFLKSNQLNPISYRNIVLRSPEEKNIASINATKLYIDTQDLEKYSDIIVDISAMPRGIFIPLINQLLSLIDSHNSSKKPIINLHVVVTENPTLDSNIEDQGRAEEATFIHGFKVNETQSAVDQEEIWIPILGELQKEQYSIVRNSINPVDISPILPFPSHNLRRGDNLIDEYSQLLFNDEAFDAKNIVYADEDNPFQVYRLLDQAIQRYYNSFKILAGCKIIITALSSKLLSIGAFLAVYEAKRQGKNVGIKQVESLGHKLHDEARPNLTELLKSNNLVHMWLAGEPYTE